MSQGVKQLVSQVGSQLGSILALAVVSSALWAAWLGWDQHKDVQPDGSETGPYDAWQVIGLVLTLLLPVCWAAARRHYAGAVLGTTLGLTAAAWYDWSEDSSGLFVIGVFLLMTGTFVATTFIAGLFASAQRDGGRPVA
ncbi:hypothetical protein [Streptomyces sp. NPDC018693]|uniref:hypothetical protein n=1 Tax=unclassified Streptomyces TaxID=2593676 RepID=UPI00379B055E